jgi:hypothetical protein
MSQRHSIHLDPEVCEFAARGEDKGNSIQGFHRRFPEEPDPPGSSMPELGEPVSSHYSKSREVQPSTRRRVYGYNARAGVYPGP